jgi:hypothetical protein
MKATFTLDEVKAAFQALEDRVAQSGVDAACMWAIHYAIDDGIRGLTGELAPEDEKPAVDDPRERALHAIFASDFDAAVSELWPEVFSPADAARVRAEIALDWLPLPAKNERLLGALEVYTEKRAGALGRGASRSEADVFAVMEARRAYRQLSGE